MGCVAELENLMVDDHVDRISDVEERAGSSTCVARSSSGAESSGTSDTNTGHHTFQMAANSTTELWTSTPWKSCERSSHA